MSMKTVDGELIEIPARKGKSVIVRRNQVVRLINTNGHQVVDTWAINPEDVCEHMSMEHSRIAIEKIIPSIGDTLVTNLRRPVLTIVEDTSPGIHDTLGCACDKIRYEMLGHPGHDNCADNFWNGLEDIGLSLPPQIPCPFNIFQSLTVTGHRIEYQVAPALPGQYVRLRAEMDIAIAFSTCPQDLYPVNGLDGVPRSAHFRIE